MLLKIRTVKVAELLNIGLLRICTAGRRFALGLYKQDASETAMVRTGEKN